MYQLEKITWLDHCGYSTAKWRGIDEAQELEPWEVVSVGWVVKDTKDFLVVVHSLVEAEESYHGEMCLLKRAIVSREKL